LPPRRPRERSELLQRLTQVAANPPPRLRDRDQVARTSETALEPRVRRLPSDVDGVLVVEGLGQRVETAASSLEGVPPLVAASLGAATRTCASDAATCIPRAARRARIR